jgi:hypothetical protein
MDDAAIWQGILALRTNLLFVRGERRDHALQPLDLNEAAVSMSRSRLVKVIR